MIHRLRHMIGSAQAAESHLTLGYVRAVPCPFYGGLFDRLRDARAVITGKAFAVRWPEGGELELALCEGIHRARVSGAALTRSHLRIYREIADGTQGAWMAPADVGALIDEIERLERLVAPSLPQQCTETGNRLLRPVQPTALQLSIQFIDQCEGLCLDEIESPIEYLESVSLVLHELKRLRHASAALEAAAASEGEGSK